MIATCSHLGFQPYLACYILLLAALRWLPRAPLRHIADALGRAAEAVFSQYLVHKTIVIGAAVALRPLFLLADIEAGLIVMRSFGGGFAACQPARRIGGLRPWPGLSMHRHGLAYQRAVASSA